MNRHWPALLIALSFSAIAHCQRTQTETPVSIESGLPPAYVDDVANFLIFKDRAFLVGDPILVAGPQVTSPSWSPTGQFLAYERSERESNILNVQGLVRDEKPNLPEDTLSVYSVAAGKSADIMRFPKNAGHNEELYWIPGSDKALMVEKKITFTEGVDDASEEQKLYILDATDASIKEFSPWEGTDKGGFFEVMPSPTQPWSFVRSDTTHTVYDQDGKVKDFTVTSQLVLVASTGDSAVVHVDGDSPSGMWSADGTRAYVTARVKADKGTKRNWYSLSLYDATLTPIATRPSDLFMGGGEGGPISVRDVTQTSTDGKATLPINALWLETLDPDSQDRLLLAGDATNGDVNKTVDCASYISQGSLFVRPISEVPMKRFDEAKVAWNHAQALNRARQDGFGLLMYADDYDDVFPSSKLDLLSILGPYMKDSSLLNDFTYTYPGGPAGNINSPTTTELGFVDCPDGRAVVYADGHCKWVPK